MTYRILLDPAGLLEEPTRSATCEVHEVPTEAAAADVVFARFPAGSAQPFMDIDSGTGAVMVWITPAAVRDLQPVAMVTCDDKHATFTEEIWTRQPN